MSGQIGRRTPRPASVAVERLVGELSPATVLARVQTLWEQAVGEAVASAAQPTALRGTTLIVSCASAVWAQELEMMASGVLGALNGALGERAVRDLRSRVAGS